MNDLASFSYLRFHIILKLQGKTIKSLHTKKRGKISYQVRTREFDYAYLKVTYGETGFDNEGEYSSADDLMLALNAFCEGELLEGLGI